MTYDYQCDICKDVKEKVHGMNETPTYICCDKPMKKVFSVPLGIHGANTGKRTGT